MGFLPEALLNYLALLGWSPGNNREVLSFKELTEKFSLNKVVKKGGVFDEKKLNWICGQHMSDNSSQDHLNTMRELDPDWHSDQDESYLLNVI